VGGWHQWVDNTLTHIIHIPTEPGFPGFFRLRFVYWCAKPEPQKIPSPQLRTSKDFAGLDLEPQAENLLASPNNRLYADFSAELWGSESFVDLGLQPQSYCQNGTRLAFKKHKKTHEENQNKVHCLDFAFLAGPVTHLRTNPYGTPS